MPVWQCTLANVYIQFAGDSKLTQKLNIFIDITNIYKMFLCLIILINIFSYNLGDMLEYFLDNHNIFKSHHS